MRKVDTDWSAIKSYSELGQPIGAATTPTKILQIMQRESYPLKEGTGQILKLADGMFGSNDALPIDLPLVVEGQPYLLRYRVENNEDGNYVYLSILDQSGRSKLPRTIGAFGTQFQPGEVALRRWQAIPAADANVVRVSSISAARPNHGGQGFSLGLGLLSNIVIADCIHRGLFGDYKKIKVKIMDISNRSGWSTNLALMLGFRQLPPGPFDDRPYDFERVFTAPS